MLLFLEVWQITEISLGAIQLKESGNEILHIWFDFEVFQRFIAYACYIFQK